MLAILREFGDFLAQIFDQFLVALSVGDLRVAVLLAALVREVFDLNGGAAWFLLVVIVVRSHDVRSLTRRRMSLLGRIPCCGADIAGIAYELQW